MNIKKLFPEKKLSKKGMLEFLDKKGFYIVLILCIAIVGVTAVFLSTHNLATPSTDYDAQKMIPDDSDVNSILDAAQADVVPTPAQSSISTALNTSGQTSGVVNPIASNTTPASKNGDDKQVVQSTPAPQKPTESKKTNPPKDQSFSVPVFGGVTFEYAQEKLVYSKTLEEWRTHSGVDLGADRGTPVKAVADGTVLEIKNDPRFGITILIEHKNGIKTVYSNLQSDDVVAPNQKIKQGDIIGSIGNTASYEAAEESHLHFEVLKDNEPVNPMTYLPKSK